MELSISKLSQILSEAFDSGYTCEDRDESINNILGKYSISDSNEPAHTEEFRIYTTSELANLAVGTMMEHKDLGKCIISARGNEKYMVFDDPGFDPALFNVDDYPWDVPMKILSIG